jgi:hypothetical protein
MIICVVFSYQNVEVSFTQMRKPRAPQEDSWSLTWSSGLVVGVAQRRPLQLSSEQSLVGDDPHIS